jgi:predicted HicB family RNase H-like nuclease
MSRQTKSAKSQTVPKWTLKGIEPETRRAIEKAAKKEGKGLGQYCNEKLRIAATETLKGGGLPIRPEDLTDFLTIQIEQLRADFKTDLQTIIQAQKARPNLFQRILKR